MGKHLNAKMFCLRRLYLFAPKKKYKIKKKHILYTLFFGSFICIYLDTNFFFSHFCIKTAPGTSF